MTKNRAAKNRARKQRQRQQVAAPAKVSKQPKQQQKKSKTTKKNSVSFRGATMNPIGPGPTGRLGLSGMGNRATTRRSQVIEEDEYIGDVLASANNFNVTQYSCNPGQAILFPWGNKIAQLYEKYQFEMLEFYFKREVSEYATLGTTGKVILSFDYDASDSAPTTKQQMEDTVPHSDGMPSTPLIRLSIDCACMANSPAKYVRPGAQPANTDIKTYDVGNLNVATYGLAATSGAVGELRVRYRVRFSEPVLEASSIVGGVAHFSGTVPTTSNNLATATLAAGYTPALGGITLGTNTIVWPAGIPGNYLVSVNVQGATSAAAFTSVSASAGASVLNLMTSTTKDATWILSYAAATAGFTTGALFSVSVATSGGTVTLGPGAIVGGGIGVDVFIVSLPSSVLTATQPVGRDEIDELKDEVRMLSSYLKRQRLSNLDSDSDVESSVLECKEADLEKSVHISQTMASKLLRAVGAK